MLQRLVRCIALNVHGFFNLDLKPCSRRVQDSQTILCRGCLRRLWTLKMLMYVQRLFEKKAKLSKNELKLILEIATIDWNSCSYQGHFPRPGRCHSYGTPSCPHSLWLVQETLWEPIARTVQEFRSFIISSLSGWNILSFQLWVRCYPFL